MSQAPKLDKKLRGYLQRRLRAFVHRDLDGFTFLTSNPCVEIKGVFRFSKDATAVLESLIQALSEGFDGTCVCEEDVMPATFVVSPDGLWMDVRDVLKEDGHVVQKCTAAMSRDWTPEANGFCETTSRFQFIGLNSPHVHERLPACSRIFREVEHVLPASADERGYPAWLNPGSPSFYKLPPPDCGNPVGTTAPELLAEEKLPLATVPTDRSNDSRIQHFVRALAASGHTDEGYDRAPGITVKECSAIDRAFGDRGAFIRRENLMVNSREVIYVVKQSQPLRFTSFRRFIHEEITLHMLHNQLATKIDWLSKLLVCHSFEGAGEADAPLTSSTTLSLSEFARELQEDCQAALKDIPVEVLRRVVADSALHVHRIHMLGKPDDSDDEERDDEDMQGSPVE